MPHITQISEVEPESGSSFNCYVLPKVPMAASALQITGIVVSDTGSMMVNGEPAVHKLMTWIEGYEVL